MWKCPTQLEVIEQVLRVGQKVKQLPAQAQRAKKAEEGQKKLWGRAKRNQRNPIFRLVIAIMIVKSKSSITNIREPSGNDVLGSPEGFQLISGKKTASKVINIDQDVRWQIEVFLEF